MLLPPAVSGSSSHQKLENATAVTAMSGRCGRSRGVPPAIGIEIGRLPLQVLLPVPERPGVVHR